MGFIDDPLSGLSLRQDAQNALDSPRSVAHQGAPTTRTRSTLALALFVTVSGAPRPIGMVQAINMTQSRQVDEEYEIDVDGVGLPADMVPSIVSSRTLSIKRFDLYASLLEQVFGTSEILTLADQTKGFSLREMWTDPTAVIFGARSYYEYRNCWFTQLSRNLQVTGDRISGADATIAWQYKVKL